MSNIPYADYHHLLDQAQLQFPRAAVEVIHTDDEVIYIDVDGHRFTFEATSEDEEYLFSDGRTTFTIPLMENPDDF